jgi:hypothetical protein
MTSVFRLYGKLLQPWITAAAYFWILVITVLGFVRWLLTGPLWLPCNCHGGR